MSENNLWPPRFCSVCGTKVDPVADQRWFDTRTGEPIIINRYVCPNARWWQTLVGKYHDR